jgi:hypothetical protein
MRPQNSARLGLSVARLLALYWLGLGRGKRWRRYSGLGVNTAFLFLEANPGQADPALSLRLRGFVLGSAFMHGERTGGRTAPTQRGDDNETADHHHGKVSAAGSLAQPGRQLKRTCRFWHFSDMALSLPCLFVGAERT